ncbi:MAG: type II toxin-antitoxin system ParD family antitoxin [Flammeovirgaceae bacterium]|jgi:antitoxin ParD1/3/4|nr:type II toxin-antitoxin system ParD family antitoxin [Flammeovirgaceae bacterium]
MGKNTSVLLGDHFEEFVDSKVASGKYSSASEVIRTALRLLESEEQKVKELKKALTVGEKSGFVKKFDSKEHLKKMHDKFR